MDTTRLITPATAGSADLDRSDRIEGEQLSLLPASDLPVQFRLDEATRRRGLRHVAEIRQALAERQAARNEPTQPRHLGRRRAA